MDIEQLTDKVKELEQTVNAMRFGLTQLQNKPDELTGYIGSSKKTVIENVIADSIQNILWDSVSFTSSFATNVAKSISPSTTEVVSADLRESDTSYGRRFKPNRESKFRTTFYIDPGLDKATVYITSPAVSSVVSSPTAIISANISFVGVKIVNGTVNLVSSINGTETLIATTCTISDATTHLLEIDYYISHTIVSIDNIIIGDISCNLLNTTLATFFPFLTSLKSSDGTTAWLTIEAYEFIQKRK